MFDWFCANKLKLNATKTKYIIITPNNRRANILQNNLSISINGNVMSQVGSDFTEKSTKFLGINIDENFSWKYHITNLNNKVSSSLFIINQAKNSLPLPCLKTLYFTLIHPHLSYGLLAWGNACTSYLQKTFVLQKRAIRHITRSAYNSHSEPLFKQLNILKLRDLYEYEVTVFMQKYRLHTLPRSFDNCYKRNCEIRNTDRESRQMNLLHIPRPRTNFSSKLPIHNFANIHNKWFQQYHENTTISSFKRTIKKELLSKYTTAYTCTNTHCRFCYNTP